MPFAEARPGLPEVLRHEDVRLEVVAAVAVERQVRGAFARARRLDAAHPRALRHAGHVRAHVGPRGAAVTRHLHVPIVGADPDEARPKGRFRDRDDRAVEFGAGVVDRHAAGRLHVAALPRSELLLVVGRQVGADDLPAVAAIERLEQVVAAEVDGARVVRREVDRRAPVEAERRRGLLRRLARGRCRGWSGRRRIEVPVVHDVLRRRPDAARLARLDVGPRRGAALALAVDDAPVGRVVLGVEAVAAADVVPEVGEDRPLAVHRRSAPGAVVLEAAVDVVRLAHVGAHGVELSGADVVEVDERLAVVVRERRARVLAVVVALPVERVHPHRVVVGVQAGHVLPGLAAVLGLHEAGGQVVDALVIHRVQQEVAVVERPAVLPVQVRPRLAAVLGAVDARPELGHVRVVGVRLPLGLCRRLEGVLDDGHQDVRLGAADGDADAADVAGRAGRSSASSRSCRRRSTGRGRRSGRRSRSGTAAGGAARRRRRGRSGSSGASPGRWRPSSRRSAGRRRASARSCRRRSS